MRLISIDKCHPGMRLAKNIYNDAGRHLLGAHVELTQNLIYRLSQIGVQRIYIEDSRTDDIVVPSLLSDRTREKALSEIRTHFRRLMDQEGRKRIIGSHFLDRDFRQVMTMIIDDLSGNRDAMIMLMDMSVADNYLYSHSLNVCIYATMLGMSSGYTNDQLMALGLGSLLHDIGKTKISQEMLARPDQLSEEERDLVQLHTEIGFRMLKDEPNIPLATAHCALQHHERINGSGYPRGLQGNDIHEFARWIGLIDTYDALTTFRVYHQAMLPHQAMEVLFAGSGTLYDLDKVKLFRDRVAIYPLGSSIGLNSGDWGIVVDVNSSCPQRPVVRILQNEAGEQLNTPYEIDLSKNTTLFITSVNDITID